MKFAIGIWLTLAAFVHAAGLEFAEPIKEMDASADAATVTAEFAFTNKTAKPVTIAKADPTCSCLKVEISGGKLRYAPGESGVVKTTFEMGNFSGTVDKMLAIYLDDDAADKPSVQLTLRVKIPVLIGVEPKTVKWDIGGKAEPEIIHILMAEGPPIHVTGIKSSSPAFKTEVRTIEAGRKYDLVVTPLEIAAPALAVLRIETDCAVEKHKVQQAFAVVRKPAKP
jgi:hypothetical protein